jgi:glycosyltransferase involved in cell wall biosynthesis
LWVGRAVRWKRPELFLALACAFPDVPFVMVCPHEGGERDVYEETKRRAAEHPNVVFTGRVPFAHIDGYFRSALVYVNTSIAEGFPNTFVQAARAGTPIVSLDVDPDGVLEREAIGFACGGDVAVAADRLRLLLSDPAEHAARAAACRRYFRARHLLGVRIGELAEILLAARR